MLDLKEEIRINETFAHLYRSEYPKSEQGESLPKMNKKMLLTPDYLRRISAGFEAPSTSILPPNCRYLEKVNKGHLVVIEEPPAFRTVRVHLDFRKEVEKLESRGLLETYGYDKNFGITDDGRYKSESLNLALPYVVFILFINDYNAVASGQIFFRIARLTGTADYLLKAPFTNISESQYICFGSGVNGEEKSLNGAIEKTISTFWSTEFNTDYSYNYIAYTNIAGVNSYMEWQALSQTNPMFIYNVDWIKLPMTISQALMEIKRHYKLTNKADMQYQTLSNLFSSPFDTGRDELPTPRSKTKQRLYFDVAEGIHLEPGFFIHVGDSFTIKNGKRICYINSFISFMDSGDIKYIRVERDDGRLLIYKYTKAFSEYLLRVCKELRYEKTGVLKNGVVIKEDDVLVMKTRDGNPFYTKVGFIRKSREGFHEGRFGNGFYILENTEASIFDVGKPKYLDIELDKDQTYLYSQTSNSIPFHGVSICKFDRVDTDGRGDINLYFRDIQQGRDHAVRLDDSISRKAKIFFSIDQVKPLPSVFRDGRQLRAAKSESKLVDDNSVFGSEVGTLYDDRRYSITRPNVNEMKKYILDNDKFHVKGFDMDIEFAIGDKVVVADWDNPVNMLSIKVIQGFTLNESNGNIHFVLSDREGKLHQVLYVQGENGGIFVGRIRKICNSFGKLTAGTKIKSKEAGILHFPKKDVNIIIGFITDTGGSDPLVLCSNCCTLWYSDVMKSFQKFTMKAKKWADLQHAPIDVSKIKYQAGDIIIGRNEYKNRLGWLVFKNRGTTALKILDFKYYSAYPEYFGLDRYITANSKLDCIPNPRVSSKVQNSAGDISAWPNLHGHYFTCELSAFNFINDERSVINVQSRSK